MQEIIPIQKERKKGEESGGGGREEGGSVGLYNRLTMITAGVLDVTGIGVKVNIFRGVCSC